ncbi:MAG: Obg family GTPase CgtA, partial [Armatimonadetes bacterium]|nr:Obg family GTPase CgtA [Armatimonadota bacterium]
TLISRLSAARPKIADYPFTTLTPNLGVVRVDDRVSYVIADLPGLIEGAAEGRGLGHQFLRHLERAKLVVHLIDLSGFERPDPVTDYLRIREELERYDPHLAELPELVVANKIDLPDARDMADIVAEELQRHGVERLYPVSAVTGEGLEELKLALTRAVLTSTVPSVAALRAAEAPVEEAPSAEADAAFDVNLDEDGVYVVSGRTVERALAMCDLDNEEAILRLHHRLTRMGVLRALREAGCGDGDAVRIGGVVLDFQE